MQTIQHTDLLNGIDVYVDADGNVTNLGTPVPDADLIMEGDNVLQVSFNGKVVSFAGSGENWRSGIKYGEGDVVTFNNDTWIALPDVADAAPDAVYEADGSAGGWMPLDEYDQLAT